MAHVGVATGPTGPATRAFAGATRLAARHVRVTVLLCVVLICGSFAAAGALQMRIGREHGLRQAAALELQRDREIATAIGARLAQANAANQSDLTHAFPQDILVRSALIDADGRVLARGQGWTPAHLPADLPGEGAVISDGLLISAVPVPKQPFRVASVLDAEDTVGAWYGSLPLYLFVILGPALVGAALAVVFVREFERRARANDTLQRLRNTPQSDARLLIRLADAERRAHEAERAKTEFVAHMSHELRTPLNAIIGFSEIISHGFFGQPGHPKYIEYARDISAAGRDLHGKIGDILEFANVEAGRYPISLGAVDVVQVASDCVDEMTGRAFSRRIELGVAPMTGAAARADKRAVKRILSNLVANALNFTPDGGQVRVEVIESDSAVIARVRDTGHGFSSEETGQAGAAFAAFERAGSATGLGLGLAIATALAERMGGEMLLVRNHGQGTTAELRLRKV